MQRINYLASVGEEVSVSSTPGTSPPSRVSFLLTSNPASNPELGCRIGPNKYNNSEEAKLITTKVFVINAPTSVTITPTVSSANTFVFTSGSTCSLVHSVVGVSSVPLQPGSYYFMVVANENFHVAISS